MATTADFIEYVCAQVESAQIECAGAIRSKKMFGEYMVYVNEKPLLLVCDNTVYLKILPCLDGLALSETGFPYKGAKEHYILDVDDRELTNAAISALEAVIPVPKPRKKKEPKL